MTTTTKISNGPPIGPRNITNGIDRHAKDRQGRYNNMDDSMGNGQDSTYLVKMDKETKAMDKYIIVGMVVLFLYGLLTGFGDGQEPH